MCSSATVCISWKHSCQGVLYKRFINGLMKNQIKQFEEVSHTDILSSGLDPAAVERERESTPGKGLHCPLLGPRPGTRRHGPASTADHATERWGGNNCFQMSWWRKWRKLSSPWRPFIDGDTSSRSEQCFPEVSMVGTSLRISDNLFISSI